MTSQKTTAVAFGVTALVVGVLSLIMGTPPTEHRDPDGYYMDDLVTVDRPSHAIITDDIETLRGVYTPLADDSFVLYVTADPVDLRVHAVAPEPTWLFIGVAATTAVDEYLQGVAHDEVTALERHDESKQILDVRYSRHEGTGAPAPPSSETFWKASVEGTGLQTLDWTLEPGDWTAVIMNADASAGVAADVAFGAAGASNLDTIGTAASTIAVVAVIGGLSLLVYAYLRRD